MTCNHQVDASSAKLVDGGIKVTLGTPVEHWANLDTAEVWVPVKLWFCPECKQYTLWHEEHQ